MIATAEVTAQIANQSIARGNIEAIRAVLLSLGTRSHIESAYVRLADGTIVGKNPGASPEWIRADFHDGFNSLGDHYVFVHPVFLLSQRVGTLYVSTNFREQMARLPGLYLGILVTVLGVSFLIAVLVGSRLERLISMPIHALAETARRIAVRNDYSLRAETFGDDEIGTLTKSFNQMLERIQNRDAALRYEISQRIRAETELQTAQQQLVDASRQEGMADVAACVLHNVGNVLNSVNVSATLIAETLHHSRADNLFKATQILDQQKSGLAAFLSIDPKGQLLPGYLLEATEHIVQERASVLTEIDLLHKNIDHIKEIVAMQQRYARSAGHIEELPIDALVEDAIRLNASAFQSHNVLLVRDFGPVPMVQVDKHKVLQVLVNLLRNAGYALDDAALQKKRLAISIRQKSNSFVEIVVDDNGIGISENNLKVLFSYGFTTRKEGHGFGLHSGALAAQQMGGRLSAESGGHMRGATFTLTLPITAKNSR